MGIITDDMRRVIQEQRLAFVATVSPDGTPNLSPKGTLAVRDDHHLVFIDLRSPATIANLRRNPAIEINVVDQLVRKGYRFKGTAEVLDIGPEFEAMLAERQQRGDPPGAALVRITVTSATPVTSPAYDHGATEQSLTERWLRHWRSLWRL